MGLMESVRRTAVLAGAVGLLAACGSSGPDGGPGTSRSAAGDTSAAAIAPFVSIIEPPDPTYHRVASGQKFQFSADYTNLAKDPSGDKRGSGYLYVPGAPVAIWI